MAYTEFRKSYGDFEIVIPAIDFSSLSTYEATKTAKALHKYDPPSHPNGWVCFYLKDKNCASASKLITSTIDPYRKGLEGLIQESTTEFECEHLTFYPFKPAGRVLRIEWCKHMAKEIEREFGL